VTRPSPANLRAFVRRTTTLRAVPDLPHLRLHTAADVTVMWHLAATELGLDDAPLPFWAFPWAGGLAVARYLDERPDEVAERRVLDLASGSGLCAIRAAQLGAATVHAVDVDPLSEAAVALNAKANDVRVSFRLAELLPNELAGDFDVILAGDVFYEERMAARMVEWLRAIHRSGSRVLMGSPDRRYVPDGLERLATYRVHTTRELERAEMTEASVYTFAAAAMPRI
jgi:predicted nicotinamide N-methyase